MMFWREGWRCRVRRALVAAAVALLAACGGGTQVDQFKATRIVAFGDENSVITSGQRKYTINFVSDATQTTPDCNQHPLWIQMVAGHYGLVFRECPVGLDPATLASRILAAPHTGVADVRTQVDAFITGDTFAASDLVTVMAGGNDIRALAQSVAGGGMSLDQAVAQVEQLGVDLADQVNRISSLGAKVLVTTVPDQSLTPDGRVDPNRAAALQRLTQRFNAKMRTGLINDGRRIGLVLFDETVLGMVNAGTFNLTDPACNDATADVSDAVLGCTLLTLRVLADGTTPALSSWLWADRVHLAPLGQSTLGSLAVTRANNNPF
jgi:hypothetical protein